MIRNSIIFTLIVLSFPVFSQKIIQSNSDTYSFSYTPKYERGLPPNLFINLDFADENGNGVLESNEQAELSITILNKGKGIAQGLDISIDNDIQDGALKYKRRFEVYYIYPGESKTLTVLLNASSKLKPAEHKLVIKAREHFGYDSDPAYLVLNTVEYQTPNIVFSGYEVIDSGEGTSTIVKDGLIQAGEQVKLHLFVQNIGMNNASIVNYSVFSEDPNLYIEQGEGSLPGLAIGEVKDFFVILSPNKRISNVDSLELSLSVITNLSVGNLENYRLPIAFNTPAPEIEILAVEPRHEKTRISQFEYNSSKISANIGTINNIKDISPAKTHRKNSVAIIFGIEDYSNLPPAPYAANDASLMKKYFINRLGVEQVAVYTNEEVDGLIFDDIFNPENGELQKAIVKGETDLFVYYSGHGIPSKDGNNIYLFPSDGKIDRLNIQGYNLNDLYRSLQKLGARSTTVFIDACFSGNSRSTENILAQNLTNSKGIRVKPKQFYPWQDDPNFSVFNSSSDNETSLGFDQSQTGLFTYYLCSGLQGEADINNDNKITNRELGSFLFKNVTETSKKIYGVQTPQFNGNEDFILLEY